MTVQYESKENAGHKFWTARYGRSAIRIDANRRSVYPWLITLAGRSVHKGVAPNRAEAAATVVPDLENRELGKHCQATHRRAVTQVRADGN